MMITTLSFDVPDSEDIIKLKNIIKVFGIKNIKETKKEVKESFYSDIEEGLNDVKQGKYTSVGNNKEEITNFFNSL